MTPEPGDEEQLLDHVAYVTGSRYRRLALKQLAEGPAAPSTIADENDVARSHVSRALSELADREIVRAHGTDSRTKLYATTEWGEQVAERLVEYSEDDER